MKKGIHPKLKKIIAKCNGCGEEFETLSTENELVVGICSKCHPFFTGTQKFVDTEGRIEKFKRRYAKVKAK